MITFDGDRSKRRKWFADKQLRIIKDIDVPAKTVLYEGFTVRVHQQGDLDGGRITAPMGLVVCRSTLDGAELFVADFWMSGFSYRIPLQVLYGNTTADVTTTLLNRPAAEAVEALGFQTVPCRPVELQSPYGLIDGTTEGPDTVWVSDQNPTIGLVSFPGEGYFPVASVDMFIDLNGNGIADFPKTVVEYFLNFYNGNGSNLGGRLSVHLESGKSANQPLRCLFGTTYGYVEHQIAGYEAASGNILCGRYITCAVDSGPTLLNILASTLWTGVPTGLRSILLNPSILITHYPVGGYAFGAQPKFLHGVNCTNAFPHWPSSVMGQWFIDNPGNDEWKLFYTISDDATVNIVNSDDFITLLDTLATVEVIKPDTSIDWEGARRMFQQLFPWPNANFVCPYDSAMFNDSSHVYTWTREYGAVKFTTAGIIQQTLYLPSEVTSTEGVRPEITYCGAYGEPPADFYVCSCHDVGTSVQAIYVGTPFITTSWDILPSVPAGHTLLYVRVVSATPEEVRLLGIVQQDEALPEVARNRACYMRAIYDDTDTFTWIGEWQLLSYLPTDVEAGEIFTAALFGIGEDVNSMVNFISRPHALPQMPVGPYAKYAIGMP